MLTLWLYQYAAYVTSFAGNTTTRKYGSSGRDIVQMLLSHPIAADRTPGAEHSEAKDVTEVTWLYGDPLVPPVLYVDNKLACVHLTDRWELSS